MVGVWLVHPVDSRIETRTDQVFYQWMTASYPGEAAVNHLCGPASFHKPRLNKNNFIDSTCRRV